MSGEYKDHGYGGIHWSFGGGELVGYEERRKGREEGDKRERRLVI